MPKKPTALWADWSRVLNRLAATLYPEVYGTMTPVQMCGEEAWREYWERGYTPEDAITEDASYWD
jgi:hypothetical protein